MLGSAFMSGFAGAEGVEVDVLDVRRPKEVIGLVSQFGAKLVVHCAADTDVEGGEDRVERTFAANAILPGLIATGCRRSGAFLVHISSTGCYGNWKREPYVEDDPLRPTTVHHRSKLAGEQAVRESGGDWIILRAGWLYGGSAANPKNFVVQRIRDARRNSVMLGDTSQVGNPTFVGDVVTQARGLVEAGVTGVFNCVARGKATRCEYVRAIVEVAGLPCDVREAPDGHFRRRAPVSPNEAAINRNAGLLGLDIMPDWRTSLEKYVAALNL